MSWVRLRPIQNKPFIFAPILRFHNDPTFTKKIGNPRIKGYFLFVCGVSAV